MIRTAPEGRWFIAGAWAIALVLLIVAVRTGSTAWWIVAVLWLALSLWVVAFFRDPERAWSIGERMVLAPADGKVVSMVETDEPAFHRRPGAPDLDLHERLRLPREPLPGERHRRVPALQPGQVRPRGGGEVEPRQRAVVGGRRPPPRARC